MRGASIALALLALLPALAGAQSPVEADVVILVYHVHPDPRGGTPEADPYGSDRAPIPEGLADRGGALRLPATRLDRAVRVSDAPEGDPASALAHFREAQDHLRRRQATGTPVTVGVDAAVNHDHGAIQISYVVDPGAPQGGRNLSVQLVVFEDGIPDPTERRLHRFVVRAVDDARTFPFENEPMRLRRDLPLDDAWDPERLGLAVLVLDPASGEVVQAASWRAGQGVATLQARKAVLVEHATATWCEACRPADESMSLLASQFGAGGSGAAPPSSYAVPPSPLAFVGAVAGGAVGLFLLRRRDAS